jgi:hypothetical protein
MKTHIGFDATRDWCVPSTTGNCDHDITEGHNHLQGKGQVVFLVASGQYVIKRTDAWANVWWRIAIRPGKRKDWINATPPKPCWTTPKTL